MEPNPFVILRHHRSGVVGVAGLAPAINLPKNHSYLWVELPTLIAITGRSFTLRAITWPMNRFLGGLGDQSARKQHFHTAAEADVALLARHFGYGDCP